MDSTNPGEVRPAVILTGPPWPRSGTARVIQNQISYYRERGFFTVFICVPIHCSFTDAHVDWPEIRLGIKELDADRTFFAIIDQRRFNKEKYKAWIRHGLRGTALDWIVFTAETACLPREQLDFIGGLDVQLVHANHVFTLGFAQRLIREELRDRRTPLILDTHDIQTSVLGDRGEINPWTHRLDSPARLLEAEIAYLQKAKVLVHVSLDDLSFFGSRLPEKDHVLALPTIDGPCAGNVDVSTRQDEEPIDVLFVGQSTPPNAAAVRWFFEQVWPLIEHHGYRLKIVGGIERVIRAEQPELYGRYCSCFVGTVPELSAFYCAARCVIAPMVSGTGVSIKTIEALAMGKPFIGTSKAYRGMPMKLLEQAGLKAHDSPQDFAGAIVQALSAESLAAQVSRTAYSQLFSRDASFASRDRALKLAIGGTLIHELNALTSEDNFLSSEPGKN